MTLCEKIVARLDDLDLEHDADACPWRGTRRGCLHDAVDALRAVVAKSEQIRAESPTAVGWGIADTYLDVIAGALFPEEGK